jgi:hypothetical protein
MNEKKMFNILSKMLEKVELDKIAEKLVIQEDNTYILFNEFYIQKVNGIYRVFTQKTSLSETFNNLRNAVIWTSFYKRNKIADSRRVKELDSLLEGTMFNIERHQKLYKTTKDLNQKSIYFDKLTDDKARRNSINTELNSLAIEVKKWQESMFLSAIK